MRHSTIIRLAVILACLAALPSCGSQKKQKVLAEPEDMILSAKRAADRIFREDFGHALVSATKNKQIEPLPGRVLVKISSSELLKKFKIDPPEKGRLPAMLKKYRLLPAELSIKEATYLGQTRGENPAMSLRLDQAVDISQLEGRLKQLKVPLLRAFAEKGRADLTTHFFVEFNRDIFMRFPDLLGPSSFSALKKGSLLHGLFKDIGIQSARRIFRSTERKVNRRDPEYTVVPLRDLVRTASARFPRRKARAYPSVRLSENMENWFILRLKPGYSVREAVAKLRGYRGVEKVSADFPVTASQYPPQFGNQWGLKNTGQTGGTPGEDIDIEPAWLSSAPSLGPVTVAVIDQGFKEDLDQFANRLWVNSQETGNGIDDDCNGYIDDLHGMTAYDPWAILYEGEECTVSPGGPSEPFSTHGTMVAGVIAADHAVSANPSAIAGTAGTTDVRLMNLVVGNCEAGSPLSSGVAEIAEALFYALDKGADVANISLTSSCAPVILEEAVQMALGEGLIIVASAGNDGIRFTKSYGTWDFAVYPACLPGVISVGGVNHFGQWWPSSNYGPGMDLVAPAENIRTITYSSPDQTAAESADGNGTSFSAAFVSGTATLVLSKYPTITAPYMRQWLRATARDITDPLGQGGNLVGDDEWTGAGVLDAGTAVPALSNPLDRPIQVDILVERLGPNHYSWYVADAVGGSPDLGITAKTPDECILPDGSNNCLRNWRLEYGVGDSPETWFPINIPDPGITTRSIDVERSASSSIYSIDVAPGHNYFNTDLLENNKLYTVRLVAENRADPPRQFIAYDWVIPTRAKLIYPFDQTTMVGQWGFDQYWGFADIRPGAQYRVAFYDGSGSLLWSSPYLSPSERNSSPNWGTWASAFMELMGDDPDDATVPRNPSGVNPADTPEGWITCRLEVRTAGGAEESDSVRLRLDNSHFPFAANWPQELWTGAWKHGQYAVLAVDMGGSVGKRIILFARETLACYSPDGTKLWAKGPFFIGRAWTSIDELPDFSVADVNNDGLKEIAFSANTFAPNPGMDVHLIDSNGNELPQWPIRIEYGDATLAKGFSYINGLDEVRLADITGSAEKEIIFYKNPYYYYGIPESQIVGGTLIVAGLNGQYLWTKDFAPEISQLPMEIGDVDNDGKDEILLEPDQILEGDGTYRPGWDTLRNPGFRSRMVNLDLSTPELEIVMFKAHWNGNDEIRVVDINGNDLPGWPQTIPTDIVYDGDYPRPYRSVLAFGQVVAGGNPEIIIGNDHIHVLGSDGQPIPSLPAIDLLGICHGLKLVDTDHDNVIDTYYPLISRWRRNMDPYRKGSYLEAYRTDGTRLGQSDQRWAINLDAGIFQTWGFQGNAYWNGAMTVDDIDGDNALEVIHIHILRRAWSSHDPDTRIEIYDIQ